MGELPVLPDAQRGGASKLPPRSAREIAHGDKYTSSSPGPILPSFLCYRVWRCEVYLPFFSTPGSIFLNSRFNCKIDEIFLVLFHGKYPWSFSENDRWAIGTFRSLKRGSIRDPSEPKILMVRRNTNQSLLSFIVLTSYVDHDYYFWFQLLLDQTAHGTIDKCYGLYVAAFELKFPIFNWLSVFIGALAESR